jgi:hypothetical protein
MTIMSQQTGTAAGPAERLAKWAPLAVILCGTFVYILDFFVVTVARDLECAGWGRDQSRSQPTATAVRTGPSSRS